MDNKEYTAVREDLATIHADLKTLTASVDEFRDVVLRRLDEQDERLRELEMFHAQHQANIEQLPNDHMTIVDNQKAVANLRKFLWAVASTAGVAVAMALLNLIIQNGEKL